MRIKQPPPLPLVIQAARLKASPPYQYYSS